MWQRFHFLREICWRKCEQKEKTIDISREVSTTFKFHSISMRFNLLKFYLWSKFACKLKINFNLNFKNTSCDKFMRLTENMQFLLKWLLKNKSQAGLLTIFDKRSIHNVSRLFVPFISFFSCFCCYIIISNH